MSEVSRSSEGISPGLMDDGNIWRKLADHCGKQWAFDVMQQDPSYALEAPRTQSWCCKDVIRHLQCQSQGLFTSTDLALVPST